MPNRGDCASLTMTDWSPAEDRRPAFAFSRQQPEKTARGDVYTLIVVFRSREIEPDERDVPCYTQLVICEDSGGKLITTHGRIYSPSITEDDAA